MPCGFIGKIVDIDLSREKISFMHIDEDIMQKWFGGRGLGVYILWRELGHIWEEIDPLGEENILLLLTGPLTGYYPGMKIVIMGKSPESNGVVGSAISTEIGIELKAAGYDGIIIRGKAEKPKYIVIHDETIEILDATKFWGMAGKDLLINLMKEAYDKIIKAENRKGKPKEPGIIYIGPAGEQKVRFAAVMSKWTHAAGYGGYGAVMGSKNLKAIVVKGTGPLPKIYDLQKYKEMLREIYKKIFENVTFRSWGTGAGAFRVGAVTSSEPIKNWQEEWHNNWEISVANFEARCWIKRFWGDYGCPVTCMKISYIGHGKYKGALTDAPDYELAAYLGTNLGIFEPEKIVYLSWLVDEYGLDGINTGNILGFVAELYERGIISENDLGGIRPIWGDVDAFAELIKMIVYRKNLGNILAEGIYRASKIISKIKNQDVMRYAVHVKGIGVGAHGVRSKLDYTGPLSYTVSVQGGDHTSVAALPAVSPTGELKAIFDDSAVICMFTSWLGFDTLMEFTRAITGWNIDTEKWTREIGLRILHMQRILLLLGGPDEYWDPRMDDDNPPRFYEPLPTGPYMGKKITKEEVEKLKKQYYEEVGYDQNGVPKEEYLRKLGIEDAIGALKRIKSRLGI